MAFRFTWPEFDQDFYVEAKSQLETALNKGNKPSVIVDHITVKELHMGTKAPELEILEIGELGTDKFRGIFKLNYAGDAYIEIQTKVQANPMHAKQKQSDLPRHSRPGILAADQPLVVPMILRISDLKLRGIVVLVVSKQKGVTLVFKNDPLESIRISSTFDSISILREFLQRQIESQLRNMLQEDLPTMIHNLSLRHIQSQQEKEEKQRKEQQNRQRSWSTLSSSCPDLLEDNYSVAPSSYSSFSSSSSSISTLLCTPNTAYDYTPTTTDYFHCKSVPITAANLFTHNRKMMLKMSNQLGIHTRQQQDFMSPADTHSCITTTTTRSMSDVYTDNADAPWYATEGPELPSSITTSPISSIPPIMEESITLNLEDNKMTSKLLDLASVNYTLSPFTTTISNFTFKSLPYDNKKLTAALNSRHKKVPKRRVTKLNLSIPHI